MERLVHGVGVWGVDVGEHGECAHYRSPLDVISIRFSCCGRFYACAECHCALEDHPSVPLPEASLDEPAVLCGRCGLVMSARGYMECGSRCPGCGSPFNAGCRLHWPRYFRL